MICFILPYLINGYENEIFNNVSNETSPYLCLKNYTDEISSNSIFNYLLPNFILKTYFLNQPTWTYYIVILAIIIMSIGASPFYTLGITFLTDHLKKDDQPIYTSKSFLFLFLN